MSTARKIGKIINNFFDQSLESSDKEIYNSITNEFTRQKNHIELMLLLIQIDKLH